MNAVVAGFDPAVGYIFKCPVCGLMLPKRPWHCDNCQAVIESYRTDMFSTIENPKVMVDLHGVVLDMCGALKEYFERRGKQFDPDKVTDYDFDCDTGVTQAEVFEAFRDIELYSYVRQYPMARDAIRLLETRVKPKLYSTALRNADIITRTRTSLGDISLSGSFLHGKKPCIFDANVLFDDCAAVHRQWADYGFGGLQYLIDRPYNQKTGYEPFWEKVIRVPSLYHGVVDMFRRFGWPVDSEVTVSE